MGVTIYVLAFSVLVVGLYAVIAKKNLIKIILGAAILDYAMNMLLVLVGYRSGGVAPILSARGGPADVVSVAVDPLPQALVLTSIVIGLGITALMVAMALRLYEKYGTFDVDAMRKLRG
jgi:multicomponent Na+:H+ antiporter subunit C